MHGLASRFPSLFGGRFDTSGARGWWPIRPLNAYIAPISWVRRQCRKSNRAEKVFNSLRFFGAGDRFRTDDLVLGNRRSEETLDIARIT
jgi:hypothetical protein